MSRIRIAPEPWPISAEVEVTIPFHDVVMVAAVVGQGHFL